MKRTIIFTLFFAVQIFAQPSYGQVNLGEHSQEDYVTFDQLEQKLENTSLTENGRSEILYFSAAANLLALFLGIITVLSAFGGIATWYIKGRLITQATKAADKRVNELIEQKLEFARNYSAVNILHQVGFNLWEYDKDEFRDIVKNNGDKIKDIKLIARSSGRAHHAMTKAMTLASTLSTQISNNTDAASGILDKENLKHLQDKVHANNLYVGMVSIICRKNLGDTVPTEEIKDAIEKAHEVIRRSTNNHTYWFELQDTAAWVLVNFGGAESIETAQNIIKEIKDGNKPSKSHESPSDARKEIFEKDYSKIVKILRERSELDGNAPQAKGLFWRLWPIIKRFNG